MTVPLSCSILTGLLALLQLTFVDGRLGGFLSRPWSGLFLWCASMAWLLAARARRRGEAPWTPGVLYFSLAAVYLSSFRWHGSDDLPTSLLPFSLLNHSTLTLDPFKEWFAGYQHTAIVRVRGHLASFYPLPSVFLALPLYLPAAIREVAPTDHVLHQLSKAAASLITAGAGAVLFQLFRRKTEARDAFWLAAVVGLGTSLFSTCSQGLWQHGASCLFLAAAYLAADVAREDPRRWWAAGLFAALSVAGRTTNVIFAAAFMGMAFWRAGLKGWLLFCAGAAAPSALLLAYWNVCLFGLPADIGYNASMMHLPPTREALLGFWFSPGRGLLFFSPIALPAMAGLWREARGGDRPAAVLTAGAAAASYLLFSCFDVWHAAFSFGPRYLTEAVLALCVFLPSGAAAWRGSRRGLPAWRAAVAASILVHATGAYARWRWENAGLSVWKVRRHPVVWLLTGGERK